MGSSTTRLRFALSGVERFFAATPNCPKCAKSMTRRTAKRASGDEYKFWGCVAFPVCLGTRPHR